MGDLDFELRKGILICEENGQAPPAIQLVQCSEMGNCPVMHHAQRLGTKGHRARSAVGRIRDGFDIAVVQHPFDEGIGRIAAGNTIACDFLEIARQGDGTCSGPAIAEVKAKCCMRQQPSLPRGEHRSQSGVGVGCLEKNRRLLLDKSKYY
jgi:hypothetical protein